MLKRLLILIFTVLLTACSNISNRPLEDKDRVILTNQLSQFKVHLKDGNIDELKPFFNNTLRNNYVLTELENTDFTNVDILYSNPIFTNNTAINTIAFLANGETIYFEITYKFLNNKWEIIDIRQKGDK